MNETGDDDFLEAMDDSEDEEDEDPDSVEARLRELESRFNAMDKWKTEIQVLLMLVGVLLLMRCFV